MVRVQPPFCARCGADKQGYRSTYCRSCWREYQRDRWHGRPTFTAEAFPRKPQVCAFCGEAFVPKIRRETKYCGVLCKENAVKRRLREARLAIKAEALASRTCLHCGENLPPGMRKEARFCSPECNSRAHALKRKLRADGYLRQQIAERDHWRCGICRKKVDPGLKHPDPGFGSLDHVIPKARGGSHDPSNLRLVHLVCNLRRRAAFDAAELALGPRAPRNLQQLSLFDLEEEAPPV